MSTILCDGEIVDDIIDEFGTIITIKDVSTSKATDEYHEVTETTTNYTTVAFVNKISESDERVREGLFQAGELVCYFKQDDHPYVLSGNYIIYSGYTYKISSVNKIQQGDTVYVKSCRALIYSRA